MAKRSKTPNDKFRHIKIKIQVYMMTDIVEESTKAFNDVQSTSRSIENTLRFDGKDPWVESKNKFKDHLDSLAKLPLYQMVENVLEHHAPGKLPGADEFEEDDEAAI